MTTSATRISFLDVGDIEAARNELIGRGVDVGEIWHIEPGHGRAPGLDPQRRSYFSRASFADPDGNTWVLEEITEQLPGRMEMLQSGALAHLLFETAKRRGAFPGVDTPHDWWDWYAAYMDAREQGSIQEEAATAAGRGFTPICRIIAMESSRYSAAVTSARRCSALSTNGRRRSWRRPLPRPVWSLPLAEPSASGTAIRRAAPSLAFPSSASTRSATRRLSPCPPPSARLPGSRSLISRASLPARCAVARSPRTAPMCC